MKYVLLTEKEFELYEKMVNEGKIGKFLNAGRGAIGKTPVFGIKRYVDGMAYTNSIESDAVDIDK